MRTASTLRGAGRAQTGPAAVLGSGREQLLYPLVRYAQQLRSIPERESGRLRKVARSARHRIGGFSLGSHASVAAAASQSKLPPDRRGESDFESELSLSSVVHPELERFPDPAPDLLECPAMRMAAGHGGNPGQPRPGLVPLDHDPVAHRSHFLPRHGSRSRSIARSVPGGRSSPACTGTVVSQSSHRTRTCDPRCRTTPQPSCRSNRRSLLPVMIPCCGATV
jgi:hypothetical protein